MNQLMNIVRQMSAATEVSYSSQFFECLVSLVVLFFKGLKITFLKSSIHQNINSGFQLLKEERQQFQQVSKIDQDSYKNSCHWFYADFRKIKYLWVLPFKWWLNHHSNLCSLKLFFFLGKIFPNLPPIQRVGPL